MASGQPYRIHSIENNKNMRPLIDWQHNKENLKNNYTVWHSANRIRAYILSRLEDFIAFNLTQALNVALRLCVSFANCRT